MFIIRLMLGGLFIISGGEKVLGPLQNFLYVISAYQVFPPPLDQAAALVFPWVELAIGFCVFLGLWLRTALAGLLLMSLALMAIVGQAVIRQLPLDSCGCFGELIHLPLQGVFFLDLSVFVLTLLCLINIRKTSFFSLDQMYALPKSE